MPNPTHDAVECIMYCLYDDTIDEEAIYQVQCHYRTFIMCLSRLLVAAFSPYWELGMA